MVEESQRVGRGIVYSEGMLPFYSTPLVTLHCGDVLEKLRILPSDSVHCVVTSPPYWGLRDYGVEGQIGLEATPAEFIVKMVAVFAEVRRVLRTDGTCWVNMGDSYASAWVCNRRSQIGSGSLEKGKRADRPNRLVGGLKEKDLVGMPWRLAFALQDDGWWLRQDIIWAKPNPMPESVTDRCTKAHEYIFLFTKSAKYYYDADAIREPQTSADKRAGRNSSALVDKSPNPRKGIRSSDPERFGTTRGTTNESCTHEGGRNKRSVWSIATEAFPEAHFATFPTKLVEPCILAGTSEKGCCDNCWTPWVRILETVKGKSWHNHEDDLKHGQRTESNEKKGANFYVNWTEPKTTGWKLGCSCETSDAVPCTVLDPFNGSGTTGLVALANRCNYIGIELNPEYAAMSARRFEAAQQQSVLSFG